MLTDVWWLPSGLGYLRRTDRPLWGFLKVHIIPWCRQPSMKQNCTKLINISSTAPDRTIDSTPHSKGITNSTESLPRTAALTKDVEEDVPIILQGIFFIQVLYVVASLSVYGKVLRDRTTIRMIRVEAKRIASLFVLRKSNSSAQTMHSLLTTNDRMFRYNSVMEVEIF